MIQGNAKSGNAVFPQGFKQCTGPNTKQQQNDELLSAFLESGVTCIGRDYGNEDEAKKARADIAAVVSKKYKGRVKVRCIENSVYIMRVL